ncbi:MAG: GntR family transcriptional regulator, partial [Psychromonas sp.]
QKGSFVFNPQKSQVLELCNYRGFIEPIALEEAVKHAPDSLIKSLKSCVTMMDKKSKSKDYKGFLVLDAEFHQLFFDHCNNHFLQQSYHQVNVFIGALRSNLTKNDDVRFDIILSEHHEILDNIVNNKIEAAKSSLYNHVIDVKEVYQAVIN